MKLAHESVWYTVWTREIQCCHCVYVCMYVCMYVYLVLFNSKVSQCMLLQTHLYVHKQQDILYVKQVCTHF